MSSKEINSRLRRLIREGSKNKQLIVSPKESAEEKRIRREIVSGSSQVLEQTQSLTQE